MAPPPLIVDMQAPPLGHFGPIRLETDCAEPDPRRVLLRYPTNVTGQHPKLEVFL